MYYKYKELHQAVRCKLSGENKKGKALWSVKEAEDRGVDFYDPGSVQKIQNKIPSKVGSLGNPPEESDGCLGRRAEAHGRRSSTGTVLRRRWKRNVEWRLCFACSVSFEFIATFRVRVPSPLLPSQEEKNEKKKTQKSEK